LEQLAAYAENDVGVVFPIFDQAFITKTKASASSDFLALTAEVQKFEGKV
jgi:hypothetical protein